MKIHTRFSEITGEKLHVQWEGLAMRGTRNVTRLTFLNTWLDLIFLKWLVELLKI